jgi:hypothetical protein
MPRVSASSEQAELMTPVPPIKRTFMRAPFLLDDTYS